MTIYILKVQLGLKENQRIASNGTYEQCIWADMPKSNIVNISAFESNTVHFIAYQQRASGKTVAGNASFASL